MPPLRPVLLFALTTSPALAFQTPELRAHYRLDETSGTTILDSSAGVHHGSLLGGYTLGQPGAAAGTETSVHFDAPIEGYAQVPTGAGLVNLKKNLTILAWVNVDQNAGVQRIFGAPALWSFGLSGSGLRLSTFTTNYDVPAGIQPGNWTHVAAVLDGTWDVTFYVEGQNVGSVAGTNPGSMGAPPLWFLASSNQFSGFFGGFLDDVQIYAGTMTDQQVLYLYQNPGSTHDALGTSYCPGLPNSVSSGGVLTGRGSDAIADDDVNFTVEDLPPNQFGYFLMSQTQIQLPVSQGTLCLGQPQIRFNQFVLNSGPSGVVTFSPDLPNLPQGTVIQPGETWNFQLWYRDNNPGPVANFSNGLSIVFQ